MSSWDIALRSSSSDINNVCVFLQLEVVFFDHSHLCPSLPRSMLGAHQRMRELYPADACSSCTVDHGRLNVGLGEGRLIHRALHADQHHDQARVYSLPSKSA